MITKERLDEIDRLVGESRKDPESYGRLCNAVLQDTTELLIKASGDQKNPDHVVQLINAMERWHVRAVVLMVYATIRTALDFNEVGEAREGMARFVDACVDDFRDNSYACIDKILTEETAEGVALGGALFNKDPNAALREQLIKEAYDGLN